MYGARFRMFRANARNIGAAESYMVQFHRHLRIRTMLTKLQPFSPPFSDRRVAPGGAPRPATTFPGWGPKI
jgi:hypothetical protein